MNNSYLTEAFKQLDLLTEENIKLPVDDASVQDIMKDDQGNTIDIIDLEAETEEELKDSYIGCVILDCDVCHSKLYKDAADVVIDEESGLANVEEECPFCYTNGGFKIIGQVAPYQNGENFEAEVEEEPVEVSDVEEVEDEEDNLSESFESRNIDNEKLKKALDASYIDPENNIADIGLKRYKVIIDDEDEFELYDMEGYDLDIPSSEQVSKTGIKVSDVLKETVENKSEVIDEAIESTTVETDTDTITVSPGENGSMAVTTEPKEEPIEDDEMIVPVRDDIEGVIENNQEEVEEPEEEEEKEIDIPIDDFDEDTFNELGEGYLKRVYENVDGFKTTSIREEDNKLFIEGLIRFNSGKEHKTSFIFEAATVTKRGKVKFIGENAHLAGNKKAFTLTAKVENNKLINESLNYNYSEKNAQGKMSKVYGTAKVRKNIAEAAEKKPHKNLTEVEGTISNILVKNKDKVNSITDKKELVSYLSDILADCKDQKAVKSFLGKCNALSSLEKVQFLVYNTLIAGENLNVIK